MSEQLSNQEERSTVTPSELSTEQLSTITAKAEAIRQSDSKTPSLDMRSMLNDELGSLSGHGLTNGEVAAFIDQAEAEKASREKAARKDNLQSIVDAADSSTSMADLRTSLSQKEGFRKVYDMNNLELRAFVASSRTELEKMQQETADDASDATAEKPYGRHADPSDTAPQSADGGASDTEPRGRHAFRETEAGTTEQGAGSHAAPEADEPQTDARAEAAAAGRRMLEDIQSFADEQHASRETDFAAAAPEADTAVEDGADTVAATPEADKPEAAPAVDTPTASDRIPADWFAGLPENIRDAVRNASTRERTVSPNVEGGAIDRIPAANFADMPETLRPTADATPEAAPAAPEGPMGVDQLRSRLDAAEGAPAPSDSTERGDATPETDADENPGLAKRAMRALRKWGSRLRAKRQQRKAYKTYKGNIEAAQNDGADDPENGGDDDHDRKEKGSKKAYVIAGLGAVAVIGLTIWGIKSGAGMTSGPATLSNYKPF